MTEATNTTNANASEIDISPKASSKKIAYHHSEPVKIEKDQTILLALYFFNIEQIPKKLLSK
jgi:hypothetical protein